MSLRKRDLLLLVIVSAIFGVFIYSIVFNIKLNPEFVYVGTLVSVVASIYKKSWR